jgi:ribonuclease VapC
MSRFVFDSSAVLAVLFEEPGAEIALRTIRGALITTVNVTEVMTRCLDKRLSLEATEEFLASQGMQFVDFGYDLARAAAALRLSTKTSGLSLGDRACLALAIREGATAVTADRVWRTLGLPCPVELIR